jgi:hypothetical protein
MESGSDQANGTVVQLRVEALANSSYPLLPSTLFIETRYHWRGSVQTSQVPVTIADPCCDLPMAQSSSW